MSLVMRVKFYIIYPIVMKSTNPSNQLQQYVLDEQDIISLNEELGRGSYGRVFTVKYHGTQCAAKEIHLTLFEGVSSEEKKAIKDGFLKECRDCSLILHPKIVQFIGIYYPKHSELPIMVMEKMQTSLTSYVEKQQSKIAMNTKFSILYDVSLGLSYLHGRCPAIIHRDLSSNNVLLKSEHEAKISDLGMAKMIRADSKQTKSKLTTAPGTLHFMPPEALDEDNPVYNTSIDVFSFGGITLHVFSEKWPKPTVQSKYDSKANTMIYFNEVERRQQYLDKMTGAAAVLRDVAIKCLDSNPNGRPSIKEVSKKIMLFMVCAYTVGNLLLGI